MSQVTEETTTAIEGITCGWCGEEDQAAGQHCESCGRLTVRLPEWATRGQAKFKWFTRGHLIIAAILLVLLALLGWANYPLLPNPAIILFKRPTTELNSASPPDQWTMDGGEASLTRYVPDVSSPAVGQVVWSRQLGDEPTRSAPTVSQNTLYAGGHFQISASDAATGEPVWHRETTGPLHFSMPVAEDLVYAGLLDHRLLVLDRETGQVQREIPATDPIITSPVISRGIVYFGTSDGLFHALDASTGDVIWQRDDLGTIRSSIALEGGSLFAAGEQGNLYILNARTGQEKLRFRASGTANGAPVVANGLAYFPAGGILYAVGAGGMEIPGEYFFSLVWAQFWVWSVPGVPKPPVQKGGRWRFSPQGDEPAGFASSPAVTHDMLYLGDTRGNFYGIDANSGRKLWQIQAGAAVLASPLVLEQRVYFGDNDGVLHSLDRLTGEQEWELDLSAPIEVPPVYANGLIYVHTGDGRVHAIK